MIPKYTVLMCTQLTSRHARAVLTSLTLHFLEANLFLRYKSFKHHKPPTSELRDNIKYNKRHAVRPS